MGTIDEAHGGGWGHPPSEEDIAALREMAILSHSEHGSSVVPVDGRALWRVLRERTATQALLGKTMIERARAYRLLHTLVVLYDQGEEQPAIEALLDHQVRELVE